MKKLISVAVLTLLGFGAFAQNASGGLSMKDIDELRSSYKETVQQKASRNALFKNQISVLSVNAARASYVDADFKYKVTTKGITNQASSGRCWLFTGLNVLRAKMISDYKLGNFEFSQNYLSFYDLLEKANLFLQSIADTKTLSIDDREVQWLLDHPIGDGGTFTGVANLVMKYGLVPKEVMEETYQSNNTRQMHTILKQKLAEYALALRDTKSEKQALALKKEQLKEFYAILVECLGVPPTSFSWTMYDAKHNVVKQKKTYSPQSFYEFFIGKNLEEEYVMLMNDPSREYYKIYEIKYDRHVYDGHNWKYVNLPIDEIKEMAIASIKDNTAMYFSCDVKKFMDRDRGTLDLRNFDYESLFGTKFPLDKKNRILTHISGSSHAMTLIAVDVDNKEIPTKWMVENSWGKSSGYNGCLIMTDEWFNEYMFRLVVEKKYVPEQIKELFKQKPILLPSWDPMFQYEE